MSKYTTNMEVVDYFVSNWNSIRNKFMVEIIDSDNEDGREDDNASVVETEEKEEDVTEENDFLDELAQCTYDINNKFCELFYVPKHWEWRTPQFSEFNSNEITVILVSKYSLYLLVSNLYMIGKVFMTFALSIFAGFSAVSYINYFTGKGNKNVMKQLAEDLEDEKKNKEEFDFKYNEFLNDKYEEFIIILNDEILLKETFHNDEKSFVEGLKKKDNHYILNLPYEENNKVVMFYDYEEDAFLYYSTRSSYQYKVCNAICRNYVYDNSCVNLFVDEEEIHYLKSTQDCATTEERDETEEKESNVNGSFDDLSNVNTEEDTSKQEEKKSVFYTKNKQNNDDTKDEMRDYVSNKFIHKGNMSDYDLMYNKTKAEKKNYLDYNEFKKLMDKIA